MQFGLFYEHQIPRPWRAGDEQKLFQEALEQVTLADRLGYDYVWAVEHHFLEEYSHSSAPEIFLAACSQRTERIRLGHGVVVMLPAVNHPARVAERLATLDLISNGRVEWGCGKSGTRIELEGLDIDYRVKRDMWEEAVRECAKMQCTAPYPGHDGDFFKMPPRNVVPKPVQQPHPRPWMACSDRQALRWAARYGMGALTFSFMSPLEARNWVRAYYQAFKDDCSPLTQRVNPNIAVVMGFYCHEDEAVAQERGRTMDFFTYSLRHYYHYGRHVPGRTNIWDLYERNGAYTSSPIHGVGTPAQLRETLEAFEEAGVDQVILQYQQGRAEHAHICETLELFARQVMPPFKERDRLHQQRKTAELAPFIETAQQQTPEIRPVDPEPVDTYAILRRLIRQDKHGRAEPTAQDKRSEA